jgi:hypothetical protein
MLPHWLMMVIHAGHLANMIHELFDKPEQEQPRQRGTGGNRAFNPGDLPPVWKDTIYCFGKVIKIRRA